LAQQPRLLDGQVRQYLDVGDGVGKRESISSPYLQRSQHFQLFALCFRKIELTFTGPDVCEQEVVRNASNEFIHGRLVVQASGELWKISPPYDPAIEYADKTFLFLTQGDTSLHE
jgi:hypothetical protein